jgi:hypothetical protein
MSGSVLEEIGGLWPEYAGASLPVLYRSSPPLEQKRQSDDAAAASSDDDAVFVRSLA